MSMMFDFLGFFWFFKMLNDWKTPIIIFQIRNYFSIPISCRNQIQAYQVL